MKIVYVTQSLGRGGAERLVLDMSHALLSANKDVQIKIISLDPLNDYPELCEGLDIVVCNATVKLSILGKSHIDITNYEQIIDNFQPDVIHSHTYLPELVCHENVRQNIAYFSHVHSNFPEFDSLNLLTFTNKLKLSRYFERYRMFKRYKKVNSQFITISKAIDSKLKSQVSNNWHNCIHLINNGIDYSKFYSPFKPINTDTTIHIANIGRMFALKNHNFLIPMMHELCNMNPTIKFKLHLFGDGPERSDIEKTIRQYELIDTVTLHGIITNVETFLSECHFYVHSALDEPFGLVVTEAMAASLPVICFNSGGPKDIVENNKSGYLLPINATPKEFALKINELIHDADRYMAFANASAERAKMFTISECAERHYRLYKSQILKVQCKK